MWEQTKAAFSAVGFVLRFFLGELLALLILLALMSPLLLLQYCHS